MRVTLREVPDRYDSSTACLPSLHFGIPAMFRFPWRILSISGEILEPTHMSSNRVSQVENPLSLWLPDPERSSWSPENPESRVPRNIHVAPGISESPLLAP